MKLSRRLIKFISKSEQAAIQAYPGFYETYIWEVDTTEYSEYLKKDPKLELNVRGDWYYTNENAPLKGYTIDGIILYPA